MKMLILTLLTSIFLNLTGCSMHKSTPTEAIKSNQPKTSSNISLDSRCNGWGMGKQLNEKNCPISCVDFQSKYGKFGAYFYNPPKQESERKTITLTFDNGYENGYTEKILDALKEKQVRAIFFLTGDYTKKNQPIIERMIKENHVLGNHSQNHPSMPGITVDKMKSEIQTLHKTISDNFGVEMNMFRPPKGEFSEQSLAITHELGYKSIFWSFAYADWDPKKQPDEKEALDSLKSHLHDGAIYLLHTVSETNANILSDFIEYVKSQGYEFIVETQQ